MFINIYFLTVALNFYGNQIVCCASLLSVEEQPPLPLFSDLFSSNHFQSNLFCLTNYTHTFLRLNIRLHISLFIYNMQRDIYQIIAIRSKHVCLLLRKCFRLMLCSLDLFFTI